ncbi:MAG: hypothetical protein NC924_10600 [Candidatus Omnitrophica bacterium]|nr:hypothetical protein [Candidatus Omnitrophota bacterium]
MPHAPDTLARQRKKSRYNHRSRLALQTALESVPAYRHWQTRDPGPSHGIDTRYAAMPALEKKDLRVHTPRAFTLPGRSVDQGLSRGEIELVKTSGTTEEQVTNIWYQPWWDASEQASWQLNNATRAAATGAHREAILTNPVCAGMRDDEQPLSMAARRLKRFLFLNEQSNPLHWNDSHQNRMVRELQEFQPDILEANPSFLAKLARFIARHKLKPYQPKAIVLTYELPSLLHQRDIQTVFCAPIVSSHGSTETGYVFMQCEHGNFHQNTEFCRVDFQPLKPEHGGPALGRLLVTTFQNPWYTLVRFDIGDLGRLYPHGDCPCGRTEGLTLSDIEGRWRCATQTVDGRIVTSRRTDRLISMFPEIIEYKLIQHSGDAYRLHIVSPRVSRRKLGRDLCRNLRRLYGKKARIELLFESALAPEASGKYQLTRGVMPAEIEPFLDQRYQ